MVPERVDEPDEARRFRVLKDSTTGEGFSRPQAPAMEATWGQGASVGSTDVGEGDNGGL